MGRAPIRPGEILEVERAPCGPAALAAHPPLDGRSNVDHVAGVAGRHCGRGHAVSGVSEGTGVHGSGEQRGVAGESDSGVGVFAQSGSGEAVHGETRSDSLAAVVGLSLNPRRRDGRFSTGVWGASVAGEGVHGESNSDVFAAVAGIQINEGGNGAGIYGEHRGDGPAGFFNGNLFVTRTTFLEGDLHVGKDIFLTGADCAEEFDLAEDVPIDAGTVMVIDEDGRLRPSSRAYDRNVAGIVSGAGRFRPAIVLDRQGGARRRVPIALVGKAYCKVDASYGEIAVGDLLTTAPRAGYAMRATDRRRAFGAVIGKALCPLRGGNGLIPALVALQ